MSGPRLPTVHKVFGGDGNESACLFLTSSLGSLSNKSKIANISICNVNREGDANADAEKSAAPHTRHTASEY